VFSLTEFPVKGVQELKLEEVKLSRSFYIPLSLHAELRRVSEERKVPMSKIVEEALRYYLEERPFLLGLLALLPKESGEFEKIVEMLREMLSRMGAAPELEQRAKALAELLTKEKKVSSGG
jgi:hypothetical protein